MSEIRPTPTTDVASLAEAPSDAFKSVLGKDGAIYLDHARLPMRLGMVRPEAGQFVAVHTPKFLLSWREVAPTLPVATYTASRMSAALAWLEQQPWPEPLQVQPGDIIASFKSLLRSNYLRPAVYATELADIGPLRVGRYVPHPELYEPYTPTPDAEVCVVIDPSGLCLGFLSEYRRRAYCSYIGTRRTTCVALERGGIRASMAQALENVLKSTEFEVSAQSAHMQAVWLQHRPDWVRSIRTILRTEHTRI